MTTVKDVDMETAYQRMLEGCRKDPARYIAKLKVNIQQIKNILGDKFREDEPTTTFVYRVLAQLEKEQGT